MNQPRFAVVAAIIAVLGVVVFVTGAAPRAADDFLFDHISFGVAEPAPAAAWYAKNLGATPEGASGVAFGSIHLRFRAATTARPSAGSVVDHLGLAVASVEAKVAELQGAGGTLVSPPQETEGVRAAVVDDPWGIRLEVVQGERGTDFHHLHLLATDRAATAKWLTDSFGGRRAGGPALEMLQFGVLSIAIRQVVRDPGGSVGDVIDHLAWTTADVDAAAVVLKRDGVKFTTEPRTTGNLKMAFVEGPNQLRVEILQR
ncbi:MAG: VOC family protein [Acidobacteriota bacterium]